MTLVSHGRSVRPESVAGTSRELAGLLVDLKERSGRSYERIGVKAHLARSTVHRYCTGASVPVTFGPLERIAIACGADKTELSRLYRVWERTRGTASAAKPTTDPEPDPPGDPLTEPLLEVASLIKPVERPVRRSRPRRFRWTLGVFAGALVVVVVAALVVFMSSEKETKPSPPVINAPMWTTSPQRVPDEFVGVTVNSPTGSMPGFGVGSVRLWDSDTRWQQVEPVRDQPQWATLDRLVDGARQAGLPVVYVFGGTPRWASPDGPPTTYPDGSRASPPDDLADWDDFVADVATRYRGRIGAYELWDMANHEQFFTGSPEVLVEMVRRAATAIRAADPAATVVCPSMGQLAEARYRDYLEQFAALGGYDHCDAAGVKLYPRRAADPPETMTTVAVQIERSLHRFAGHVKLWNTGTDFEVPFQPPVDPERAADHVARFFLTGVYLRYDRMYFYNWGGARLPIVLQPEGGPATPAAAAAGRVRGWLAGADVSSCRHGTQAGLPGNVWTCDFTRDGKQFEIWWTHEGTAAVQAPLGRSTVERLDGTTYRLGEELALTGSPVFVR